MIVKEFSKCRENGIDRLRNGQLPTEISPGGAINVIALGISHVNKLTLSVLIVIATGNR